MAKGSSAGGKAGGGGAGGGGGIATDRARTGEGGLAQGLVFTKPPGEGQRLLKVDVAKLDKAWQEDRGFYLGPGGTGRSGVPGRYNQAREFIQRRKAEGKPVDASKIYVDKHGRASFGDGRHRFAVLRDAGAKKIPIAVSRSQYDRAKRLFGA